MIPGLGPVPQALLGTLLTWGLTAAGSALVFVFSSGQRRILDGSLGFAAGVMLAASYWSLLAPAIELAEESGTFGAFSFFPVAAGFALGAAFVYGADLLLPLLGFSGPSHAALSLSWEQRAVKEKQEQVPGRDFGSEPSVRSELAIRIGRAGLQPDKAENGEPYQRRRGAGPPLPGAPPAFPAPRDGAPQAGSSSWRRILLMILAITIHNIPEGLAVGVGFGAIGKSESATFQSARNLAIGIGVQNFPEGLAVSLPLRGAGFSTWKAFWYGQLSGMVEPLAGVLGAFAVVLAEPLLPYALGFAAGAMVYVVMDDIIPEAQTSGNGKLASWTSILGFVVMMSLDVGLG
ncbi:zinc transporter ZIP11 isoform X2 [Vidua macroura]|nr:zinc transporter ZIP11 isoform X2 [Vidua macroura]XP_053850902.1 zinc transporter ZIP11 isoform X2 [Vidua macroura]XP_053850904.1 zinc transporter ZIP11 isoform X2 [Vidua macroura]